MYVFFKGRFSPYWYFGFSGIITGWDDVDAYEGSQEINIKCEDVSSIWKRAKLSRKTSFYPGARGETRMQSTSRKTAYNIYSDPTVGLNFSNLIKMIAFSYDFGLNAYNCHISSPGVSYSQALSRLDQPDIYKEAKQNLHTGASIDHMYMFTKNNTMFDTNTNTIKANKINYPQQLKTTPLTAETPFSFKGGPNEYQFSPVNSLYLQLNEITIPQFQAKYVKPYLDISVRFWESNHTVDKASTSKLSGIGTGWKDSRAFGVAGVHPALTYDFINNFNIIDNIWKECYASSKALSNVILTPLDQIRSSLVGSPTEATRTTVKLGDAPEGTQYNLFRPRLFVIEPLKFADRLKGEAGTITSIGALFDEQNTTVYAYLHEKLKAVEYITYATPMGDIIIEPEMYDSHPLEFSTPIEARNIVKKDKTIKLRTSSIDKKRGLALYDKAYFYDPKANHPFFLMEKDRIRCTQTFKQELIYTSVEVCGGQTAKGGIFEIQTKDILNMTSSMASTRGRAAFVNNKFAWGKYTADGFEKFFDAIGDQTVLENTVKDGKTDFEKMVFMHLLVNNKNTTVQKILDGFIDIVANETPESKTDIYYISENQKNLAIQVAYSKNIELTNPEVRQAVYSEVFPDLKAYLNKTIQQLINSSVKEATGKAKETAAGLKNGNSVYNLLGVTAGAYVDALAAFDTKSFVTSKNSGISMAGIRQLVIAYAPAAAKAATTIANTWVDLYVQQKQLINSAIQTITLADEQDLADQQLYDPRKDLVKLYGYNPAEPIKNSYIENGEEAYDYAKTVFNRFLGKAFEIHMDVIGRPELLLNKTCYCEKKDAIGLITNYSIKWSHGGDFTSAVTLSYARKNTVLYAYGLGKLDPFVGSVTNDSFQTDAELYYKWNKMATTGVDTLGKNINDAISGPQKGIKTIIHTTETQTAIDGSALKASANISSNLSSAPVAIITAKSVGTYGNSITYTSRLIDTIEEGAVSFKLLTSTGFVTNPPFITSTGRLDIVQLYGGDLGLLSVGQFLVFKMSTSTGFISEAAEIKEITYSIIYLVHGLQHTYPADTVVTRMDWQLTIGEEILGTETKGPFPVCVEGNEMFSQSFALVDIKKSDKWYKGRNIYPIDANSVRLSGGTATQTIATKVLTSTESSKSSTATARKLAGNFVGTLTKNLINSFLPLGGLYSAHDRIGHMEFDKRGFTEQTESMSFARAHSLGQTNYLEDAVVYEIVSEITAALTDRKTNQTRIESLTESSEKIDFEITALDDQLVKLGAQISSTTEESKKTLLINEKIELNDLIEYKGDEINSIDAQIDKLTENIDYYNLLLYGDKAAPPDVGEYMYNNHIKYITGGFKTGVDYDTLGLILNSYFYKLYMLHLSLVKGEAKDWRVTEVNPTSVNLEGHGSSLYYIKRA